MGTRVRAHRRQPTYRLAPSWHIPVYGRRGEAAAECIARRCVALCCNRLVPSLHIPVYGVKGQMWIANGTAEQPLRKATLCYESPAHLRRSHALACLSCCSEPNACRRYR